MNNRTTGIGADTRRYPIPDTGIGLTLLLIVSAFSNATAQYHMSYISVCCHVSFSWMINRLMDVHLKMLKFAKYGTVVHCWLMWFITA